MLRIAHEALTFDDVLLVPAHSAVLPKEVELKTHFTRDIELNIPLVSAAMDTVTEARLAIAMAQEGGIGIVHKNMDASAQAENVRLVKKYESGVIKDPLTVSPDTSIRDVLGLTRSQNISGVPVVDKGNLVGLVTSRDLRFEDRYDSPVSQIMTPKEKLVTVKKKRMVFVKKDFEIALDKVDDLGYFIEIESLKDLGGVMKTRKRLIDFAKIIGIDKITNVAGGYAAEPMRKKKIEFSRNTSKT